MNHSPIDVLLQLSVPRVEPAPAGARPRDESSAFDNHFRQANNPVPAPSPAPSASQPSQKPTDTPSVANSQTPAPSSSSHAKTPTETDSASESAATISGADKQTRSNEDEHEDAAADVVAVVALAQVAEAASSDLVAEANGLPAGNSDDAAPANSDDEQRPRTKEAKPAARATSSSAGSDAPAKTPVTPHAAGDVPSDAAQVTAQDRDVKPESTAVDAAAEAAANPAKTSLAPTETAADASQPKTRRDEKHREPTSTDTSAAKQPAAQAVDDPAPAIKQSVAAKKSTGESLGDATRKGDRKVGPRSTATPAETSATPADRPAAVAATVDTPAAPAVSQPQLLAADVAAAATTNSASKPQDTQSASKQGFLSPFARLERGAHSARGTNHTGPADAPRHIDPARFISRVARAIHTARERGGPLQLRLSPPELGAMRLELSLNQGTLTATIETDNSATRQLLLDNLPALRERLAEQNVKIERFDVDVRRDTSGNQQNAAPQDRGQAEHRDRNPGRNTAQHANAATPSVEETAPIRRNISNTSINVVA